MTRLIWDTNDYQYGVSYGVFYPPSGPGLAWNGLTSVTETSDSEEQAFYEDGIARQRNCGTESFSGTIEAFTYPDELYDDVLSQRRKMRFGLSYRVETKSNYIIHLVYDVLISPSQYSYRYSETDHFSWDFTTRPRKIPGGKSSAHLFIPAAEAHPDALSQLEDILYGSDVETPRLPTPDEVFSIFEASAILQVVDHGDGTFTVTGPDDAVFMLDSTAFEINWPSVVYIDSDTYEVSSW